MVADVDRSSRARLLFKATQIRLDFISVYLYLRLMREGDILDSVVVSSAEDHDPILLIVEVLAKFWVIGNLKGDSDRISMLAHN